MKADCGSQNLQLIVKYSNRTIMPANLISDIGYLDMQNLWMDMKSNLGLGGFNKLIEQLV